MALTPTPSSRGSWACRAPAPGCPTSLWSWRPGRPSPTLTLTLQPASHPLHQGHKLWMIFLLSVINKLTTGVDLPARRQQGARVGGSLHVKPGGVMGLAHPGAVKGPRPAAPAAQRASGSRGGPRGRGRHQRAGQPLGPLLPLRTITFPNRSSFLLFFPPSRGLQALFMHKCAILKHFALF